MSYSFREVFLDLIYALQPLYTVMIAGLCCDVLLAVARTASCDLSCGSRHFSIILIPPRNALKCLLQ